MVVSWRRQSETEKQKDADRDRDQRDRRNEKVRDRATGGVVKWLWHWIRDRKGFWFGSGSVLVTVGFSETEGTRIDRVGKNLTPVLNRRSSEIQGTALGKCLRV